MKTCFPARKQNGENYATLDEMMGLIGQEPHGSWLAGTNKMWHGGLHITEKSAPASVLKPETMETAVPLQCMAGGDVVAWRVNKDYKKSTYLGQPVQYTTTFVLVKSVCQPDPKNDKTWLEFYTLYLGLAPLSAFEKRKRMKVLATSGVKKHPKGKYEASQTGSGDIAIPESSNGTLAKDSRVLLLTEGLYSYKGQANQPFGLAQSIDTDGKSTGEPFWVTTSPEYMIQDGEQYARLPSWMQQAVAKGTFDTVTKPDQPLKINAGDAIGFLGEDIAPAGMAKTSSSTYAHVEVLSADSRMPSFLDNPGQIKEGRKYIRVHPDAMLYTNSGDTFTKTTSPVSKDMHVILPVDKCSPKTASEKTYYQLGQQSWLIQDYVDVFEQYWLKELGFSALVEESTSDMSASLKEGWMKSAYQWLAEQVRPERGIQEKQMSSFYKGMIDKMDTDKDGQLSERELFTALHHPEMGVRDIVSRMVVKHESEWFGGSSHQKWTAFFQDYDTLRIDFAKKWLDDMEWMSKVEPFTSGKAVWHMHPIVFLSALKTEEDCAKLIWGEVVNQRLGAAKACLFRKKVIKICAEMWGEAEKLRYADVLMGCMSVETNRMFSSSVIAYRKVRHKNGDIIFVSGKSGPRPKIELHAFTRDEITKDNSLVEQNAVGLIQFTSMAVQQINITNNMSLTKLQLALMDEIEQLDYVKLYFTSNKDKFDQIKTPEDVYTYIFCPEGVGKPDDAVLYSKVDNERAYKMNASLDSTEHGNKGNNDGLIQKRELLVRLNTLISEGERYRNQCDCIGEKSDGPDWMPVALSEFSQYRNLIETDSELNNKIKIYHNTTTARGSDGTTSWCSSFVNWCLMQTKYAPLATHSALAYSWGHGTWENGEIVDKPFYGAIAVMNYSHVGFVCGINPDGRLLILGGNQGGGRVGTANCISIRANSASSIKFLMKPKGYIVRPEDYELKVINVSGPSSSYSDTH
ncbi:MAG: hypothetical protein RR184_14035 [Citrobacter sp.]|uniref:CHAP domain-containing protein n=1 Tax=Citrobacter sp. TaxID=1896336 RepID=UPI002FC5C047